MMYSVHVDRVGVYYHGDNRVGAESAYYTAIGKWGRHSNVTMSDESGEVFKHDIRTALWRERGIVAAREERDCFYLHDGSGYVPMNPSKDYKDILEYTQSELQTMYAAWVAGWTEYHR